MKPDISVEPPKKTGKKKKTDRQKANNENIPH